MPDALSLSYVLPVHNDEDVLASNVAVLVERLARTRDAEIVLVENGSRDRSWEACEALAGKREGVHVLAYREANAGLGYAYARGLSELAKRHGPDRTRWTVLTGTDLPFAFSDLDQALPLLHDGATRAIAGSKAHPDSLAWAGPRRFAMSVSYRFARRVVLGMKVRDSQGSFVLRLDLVHDIAPLVQSRDFFYTTELAYLIEAAGERIVEVPVVLEAHQLTPTNSTVRPLKDASRMLKQLVALRRRAADPR
jgi:dolichyl-phosphate beta-glucosyltransferase